MLGRQWEICSGNCPAERPCTKEQSEHWRGVWDGEIKQDVPAPIPPYPMSAVQTRTAPCIYLGEPTGEKVECESCQGKVELKMFACACHGKCTVQKAISGLACCAICADFQAADQP
jgi:hypothetical protein